MQLETSSIMLILFILLFVISVWKIYAFLPNKQLADDDTTQDSQEKLLSIMLQVIAVHGKNLDSKKLFELMLEHKDFDKKRFWRFSQNKLNQLLIHYYMLHPPLRTIEEIYKKLGM